MVGVRYIELKLLREARVIYQTPVVVCSPRQRSRKIPFTSRRGLATYIYSSCLPRTVSA